MKVTYTTRVESDIIRDFKKKCKQLKYTQVEVVEALMLDFVKNDLRVKKTLEIMREEE